VDTIVPVLAHEITISAGTDFISSQDIATSVGTIISVLTHKLTATVGTDVLVVRVAQELFVSEDTPVAVSAHDLYVSEGSFVPNLAR
jgi:hypothetical protein